MSGHAEIVAAVADHVARQFARHPYDTPDTPPGQ